MDEKSASYAEQMHVLEMIEQGVITATQGSELLLALQEKDEHEDPAEIALSSNFTSPPSRMLESGPGRGNGTQAESSVPPGSLDSKFAGWRNWWYVPLSIGILATMLSSWFLYVGMQNEWAVFWMVCFGFPLLFGIFLTTFSWYFHNSPWLHVRVNTGQDEWPRRIAISLPLPLHLGAWIMHMFQDQIPGLPNMENVPLDEIVTAVRKGVKPEEPIYIEVDNGPGQERVEVYIG